MIAGLLLGLAAVGPEAPEVRRHQTIFVGHDATHKGCVPQVNGVDTGDIATEDGQDALIAALPDKGIALHLIGKAGGGISYDCMADIVKTLRHAGFYGTIGAISQVP